MDTFLQAVKEKLLPAIGERMKRSVMLNFKAEGRPNKWKQSHRAKNQGGKTLSDTGILRDSIHYEIKNFSVIIGTNVEYAAIHQFGGKINKTVTVNKHKRTIKQAFGKVLKHIKTITVQEHQRKVNFTIPKRPFLLIQKSDIQYISKKLNQIWRDYANSNN